MLVVHIEICKERPQIVLDSDDRSPKVSRIGRQSPKMKLRLNLCASVKLGPNGLHTTQVEEENLSNVRVDRNGRRFPQVTEFE